MGGYWLRPRVIASLTAVTSFGSHSKSGNPWPRLTAPVSAASADMTVKIVVPTEGSLVVTAGVRSARGSELIVVRVASHGLRNEVAVEAVGEQFREPVDEVAEVGAPLERDPGNVLPEQRPQRPDGQVCILAFVAHRHLRDDAD